MIKGYVEAGDVFYDPFNNKLLVYSGHLVEDNFGQNAFFMHDRPWNDAARKSHGVIYTVALAFEYLERVGTL